MAPNITIYSTENCSYCLKAKAFFKKIGRDFKEVSMADNPKEVLEAMNSLGVVGGFPIIRIGNNVVQGFNPIRIAELL